MSEPDLTPEELAGLRAIDGTMGQRRPSIDIEIRLRALGLIERTGLSRMPIRTRRGDDLVKKHTRPHVVG
ncbi:hypothetical protein [Reyranella aquatilis]|uniref:DUF4224 domain-containing protein n=1 Tax=Reyranella aquatilis TaxID=2035356 RepID=A0ABS8L213_9HYPH|nr:hypothetical protein [Reyranella aquatilis]MCC8432365.1 hypothetical protein [Reyranella aquatilis]